MTNSLNIALPKGRLAEEVFALLKKAGYIVPKNTNTRKLIIEDKKNNFTYFLVKPTDVITYVEEGVCDIGIIGKDNILEEDKDIYELLDLSLGQCKMVVAGINNSVMIQANPLKVATKYPKIAKTYFKKTNTQVDIIKLNGSVELGPLVGLSDVIVDIYETGNTLKANGLNVFDDIVHISSRLIANKASYRLKNVAIKTITNNLQKGVDTNA
ncbi:MAG: ATP phosphoribosyltransferase [Bacillota bacterium]